MQHLSLLKEKLLKAGGKNLEKEHSRAPRHQATNRSAGKTDNITVAQSQHFHFGVFLIKKVNNEQWTTMKTLWWQLQDRCRATEEDIRLVNSHLEKKKNRLGTSGLQRHHTECMFFKFISFYRKLHFNSERYLIQSGEYKSSICVDSNIFFLRSNAKKKRKVSPDQTYYSSHSLCGRASERGVYTRDVS